MHTCTLRCVQTTASLAVLLSTEHPAAPCRWQFTAHASDVRVCSLHVASKFEDAVLQKEHETRVAVELRPNTPDIET